MSTRALAAILLLSCRLGAQQRLAPVRPAAEASQPVQPLGQRVGIADSLQYVGSVRELRDGRVLVVDRDEGYALLFDATLATKVPVVDSERVGHPLGLGATAPKAIAFAGDSTLYVDPGSLAILVLDPAGRVARTMAAPQPRDTRFMVGSGSGWDGRDAVVYQGERSQPFPPDTSTWPAGRPVNFTAFFDSVPIVRGSMARHMTDTLGFVRSSHVPRQPERVVAVDGSHPPTPIVSDPLPLRDAWATLSSGTVAIVRAQSFQIDFVDANGARRSVTVPHEPHRLTDSAKAAIVDSAQRARDAHPRTGTTGGPGGTTVRFSVVDQVISADEVRDYRSPFLPPVYADAEDHLWVQESEPDASGGALGMVYDVVDTRGQIIERVDVPGGTTIVGFGPGTIYLTSREGRGITLAKYRIR